MDTLDRMAFNACLAAAMYCELSIRRRDIIATYRATEQLRVTSDAVAKGQPKHARVARQVTDLNQKWHHFCEVHKLLRPGMASDDRASEINRSHERSREFGSFVRALGRIGEARGSKT